MSFPDLKILPRFSDGLSFVYLEHAVVEREDRSVAAFTTDGRISLPAAGLGCLMLGPGTRITHAALKVLADCGATAVWVGEDGLRFYATGLGKTRSSAGVMRQAQLWAYTATHRTIVRRLYERRFGERLPEAITLQQIRGREGARVRDAYRAASQATGVPWVGRSYKRDAWNRTDPVNCALSASNAALYAVCLAGIVTAGYSPALGFIHVGKQLSFVYDLADLYKLELSVPAAFEAAAEGLEGVERRARLKFRERAHAARLLDRVMEDLREIFSPRTDDRFDGDAALPGGLWDPDSGEVAGGVQHADDGDGGGSDPPEG
jgi:CRISPR-associated protein Cas1